jgi:prolyl 4-hydroxylase
VCRRLVVIAAGRTTQALVYDAQTGRGRVEAARTNTALELTLLDLDVVVALVRARISAAVDVPASAFEPPQVLRYEVGQKFDYHYDFLVGSDPGYAKDLAARGQRIFTALIYLNDAYEGGATEFPRAGVSFRGGVGEALIFSNIDRAGEPDPLSLHAGAPPTRGTKWVFSQWIRSRIPNLSP